MDNNFESKPNPDILICIPAYNAESSISEAVLNCKKYSSNVIVIDDGSIDKTAELAINAGAEVITHKSNRGYGGAIKSCLEEGLRRNSKVTITFDADLQHDSNDIPKLVRPIQNKSAEIVIGSRFLNDNNDVKKYRKFGIKIITNLVNLFFKNKVKDAESGLRAYSLDSLKAIVSSLETDGMGMSAEILLRASVNKLKIIEVPRIEMYPDKIQTSTKNPIFHGLSVIVTIFKLIIETKPLLSFGIPSLFFFIISIFCGYFVIDYYNEVGRLPLGLTLFTLLIISIAFFLFLASMILYILSRISYRINFNAKR